MIPVPTIIHICNALIKIDKSSISIEFTLRAALLLQHIILAS